MAYFPNGTAGACYEGEYCCHCVHQRGEDGEGGCVVWLAHLLYSYELCNEKDHPGKVILDLLIPETKDGLGAEQCAMFHARTNEEAEEAERRRLAEQPRKYQAVMAEMGRAA
jgi:hypothetical protein